MTQIVCRGCGGKQLNEIIDLGTSPPANTPSSTQRFPLQLMVCQDCWLVQMRDVVPDDVLFDSSYTFYSSTSPGVVRYDEQMARELVHEFPKQSKHLVVEIAANDGSLLQHFTTVSRQVIGVDPAAGPSAVARDRGITTIVAPFGRDVAADVRARYGPAGLIIGKNVIAHVADVNDMFAGISMLLSDDGIAVVEFQYLADLIVGNQFDQVYHEHRFFYSLSSLTHLASKHGLHAVSVRHTEPQGGSLRVCLSHVNGTSTVSSSVGYLLKCEKPLRAIDGYLGLQLRANRVRERLWDIITQEQDTGRTIAGYGAPAKATTLVNFCGLDVDQINYITDLTPAKQGTLLPGTSIPIVAPSDRVPPSTFLLTAWNYMPEIIRREKTFLARGGRLIVPLPAPVVI